ncbi:Gfo/Idh/MocA family oxidoreductase [Alkalihalobacillus oceani]|uniref:Gfo/Idh/MocA family oxidoreductase n=1 Tax=Halalkalibacter oceani TaxID=1653776 RepID=A0A9X2DPD9_9BACI|nr:Gfo/Idh/MocA family oxidoreductase [Halalkalibacter oceani]MCM3714479.1 Gfo/Idh/MocA family oxidoreductase [Halalkalibacter oceani]
MKIGVIGCGNISSIYLENCQSFAEIDVKACADLHRTKAEQQAKKFGIPFVYTVEELLADQEIEVVINLTIPKVHAEVSRRVLEAGKHVYVEKPLAAELDEGEELVALAAQKGLRIGSAPDTFLGAGIQTCKKLIDEGAIGRPLAVTGFMLRPGHEWWHPDPAFFYERGGGPMFDMGPYYLTAFVQLLGPMKRVTCSASKAYSERVITSEPKYGEKIPVETPTYLAGTIEFQNGVIGTLITSFDTFAKTDYPNIEIFGTKGVLRVPDPNRFGGPVYVKKQGEEEWMEVELTHSYDYNARGLGVLDLVTAIRENREHRANGNVGLHVLEVMHGFHRAAEEGRHYTVKNQCDIPKPLPEEKKQAGFESAIKKVKE